MASIPQDPPNTQIGLASVRSSGKVSPDVEPFSLTLGEGTSTQPAPPRKEEQSIAPKSPDRPAAASTEAGGSASSCVQQTDGDDEPPPVDSSDKPQQQDDQGPTAVVNDGQVEEPKNDEESLDESTIAAEAVGASALATLVKSLPDSKPAASNTPKHLLTTKIAGERRIQPLPHTAIETSTTRVDGSEEVLVESGALLVDKVNIEQVSKKATRKSHAAEQLAQSSSIAEAKTKRSRKPVRDGSRSSDDDHEPSAPKDSQAVPKKVGAANENPERTGVRGSKRAAINQTPFVTTTSEPSTKATTDIGQQIAVPEEGRSDANAIQSSTSRSQDPSPPAAASSTPAPRLHEHLISRASRRGVDAPNLNQADTNRFLQRVARAFDVAKNRDGEIRLRLSPPELGSMRLEVRMQQGGIIARLETETPAARTLLMDNLPVLRERLAEQGVHIEQFDVDLLDRRDQSSFQDQRQTPDEHPATFRHESEPPHSAISDIEARSDKFEIDLTALSKRINVII